MQGKSPEWRWYLLSVLSTSVWSYCSIMVSTDSAPWFSWITTTITTTPNQRDWVLPGESKPDFPITNGAHSSLLKIHWERATNFNSLHQKDTNTLPAGLQLRVAQSLVREVLGAALKRSRQMLWVNNWLHSWCWLHRFVSYKLFENKELWGSVSKSGQHSEQPFQLEAMRREMMTYNQWERGGPGWQAKDAGSWE